jgi:RNA polymerase sigma-70 factor (ECF subfamily)
MADEQLLDHLKRGHHDALAVLFDRYHQLVLSIARKILRDATEAEDVVQTVFFEIFRAARLFDPSKGSAKAWVVQYAYHRSINRKHYLKLRSSYNGLEISHLDPDQLPDPNGHDISHVQESADLVHKGLETLSWPQRTALELAFFEGLTMTEISQRMKESLGNVRHYYYRGLAKLRARFSSELALRKNASQPRQEAIDVKPRPI